MMIETIPYQTKHKIRIVTAAALFDGHDAAINIMRRVMQSTGAEIIHLGHDRSVQEIVDCAIQEDAKEHRALLAADLRAQEAMQKVGVVEYRYATSKPHF